MALLCDFKVTTSLLEITKESQEVNPFPQGISKQTRTKLTLAQSQSCETMWAH